MGLTRLQQQMLTKLRKSGASDLGVALDDERLGYLLALIIRDLGLNESFREVPPDVPELYDRVDSGQLVIRAGSFSTLFEQLLSKHPDADTYLFCLGTLLKARLKYERILQAQPIPTVEQIGPRSLLQFGQLNTPALAAFLFWRKWIFDIDNRAGQETGYLFEPILAQALGGVPYGGRNSPVRRDGTGKGRQVDCVRDKDGVSFAYELKLRVTIAASGQGRWAEELAFPEDCRASRFVPVLVVFDETPNPKLKELEERFRNAGGHAFVGEAAWTHLENEAGVTMSRFIEKYVRQPIKAILENAPSDLPPITFSITDGSLVVSIDEDQLVVTRVGNDDPAVAELLDESDNVDGALPDDIDEHTATA